MEFTEILILLIVAALLFRPVQSMAQGQGQGQPQVQGQVQAQQQPIIVSGDDRYSRAPRPQRNWDNGPEIPIRGAMDPIPTRGAPEAYQQMGIMTVGDKVLPLYGRRVAPRSDYFNYYTRTDTYNPVAVPVSLGKRDCQDNAGCGEVFNGDQLKLAATGESGKVTLYGFDGPRYVPP
jgi:hypothetical protein